MTLRQAQGERVSLTDRKRAVLARVRLGELVEAAGITLSGSAGTTQRRARCPFHQGNSASFAVVTKGRPEQAFGYCFGCQWHGTAIDFVAADRGLAWIDALAALEAECGLGDGRVVPDGNGPVQRERNPASPQRREKVLVEPIDCGRAIWRRSRPDPAAVRRYFTGRGVPAAVLTDARIAAFRYQALCPLQRWELRSEAARRTWPRDALVAPAVIALVRKPVLLDHGLEFVPIGLHVTYLNPDGTGTMVRRKPWAKPDDPEPLFPKRKMWGPVGNGAVLLGDYSPDSPLFVGEGNETVLSAIALAGAGEDAIGVAVLSLDNLQGHPKKWKAKSGGSIWPLHAIAGDPGRGPFTIPGHRGAATGLIDADMSALKRQKVVERTHGPIVDRAITGAERAEICAALFVQGWRRVTAAKVAALRAPAGMDFNDVVRGEPA